MQAPTAGKPGFVNDIKQGLLWFPQHTFGVRKANELQKFLRVHTCPFGKQTLEMKWAQMHILGNSFQIGLVFVMLVQIIDRGCNVLIIDRLLAHFI